MLKIIAVILSIFLIFVIFLRIPQEEMGLTSAKILKSPSSSQQFLNNLTVICILIYFGLAFLINFLDI